MSFLEKTIHTFLQKNDKNGKPFLLALSGGPDSMALFTTLLDLGIFFHVAHVNHNWRRSSGEEELYLKKICFASKIPFHTKGLIMNKEKGNLEDLCRMERLQFFQEVVLTHDLQGVILAHHADDQAETVMKRIFEGASLSSLKGLLKRSYHGDLLLLRPLLEMKKKDLVHFLEKRGIAYFIDITNEDTKFLRPRFRKEIFPLISKQFGKEIVPSLSRLAQYAEELHEFLEGYLESFRKEFKKGEGKYSLDLSDAPLTTLFAWKIVVKDFFLSCGIALSQPTLETVVYHAQRGKGKGVKIKVQDKGVTIAKKIIEIDL